MPNDAAPIPRGEGNDQEATAEKNRWYVWLLGGLCVARLPDTGALSATNVTKSDDAVSPRFQTHKAALLFAHLILYPYRAHGRDELADWLWPDLPADKGRANLSQALRRLKIPFASGNGSEPNAPLFTADHQTVRVRAGVFQTDVSVFEKRVREVEARRGSPIERAAHWKTAIESYGGDLLPGFYDDWIERERQRLRDLFDRARAESQQAEQAARNAEQAAQKMPPPHGVPAAAQPPHAVGFPLTLTRFFGRATERADLCARLTDTAPDTGAPRLITLTGAGGMGKTRLALQAVQQIADTFVFAAFVSLAEVSDANHIAAAILPLVSSKIGDSHKTDDPLPLVAQAFHRASSGGNGDGRVLLILDNMEQFGDACAPVVARLLASVPALTVLATSRQPVGVTGEQEILLGPLRISANKEGAVLPPDVGLFVDRARLVRPQFALTPQNETSVRELCSLLEGVPLAIELAAAWIRTHSPAQIIERLCFRFDLLQRRGAASADLPKRHRSLHAAIAWSYDLLPPNLQAFWAQLFIFRGGWTADAARAVTGLHDANEPLLLLVERSLILAEPDETTGETRYRMLESLREFAQEQAHQYGDDFHAALTLRHTRYFADLSREADAMTENGRGMRPALALLGTERENLRTIFTTLQEDFRQKGYGSVFEPFAQAALETIVQSVWLWSGKEMTAYLQWAMNAIRLLPDEAANRALRASVLALQGRRASLGGDYSTGEHLLNESLALWQALGNEKQVITVKKYLSAHAAYLGNDEESFAIDSEILRFAQETGDLRLEAAMLHNMAMGGPDLNQRRKWSKQAVSLHRKHWPGSTFLAVALSLMGEIASEQKDWQTAQACLEEAHDIALADGAREIIAVTKQCLADFFNETGTSLARAEALLRDAQDLYEELEEWPRIVRVLFLRFQIALKRGDFSNALDFACDYLTTNRDAHLMDEAHLCAAHDDLKKQLREAGYSAPLSFVCPLSPTQNNACY